MDDFEYSTPMAIRYAHTNIISSNWQKLGDFYQTVFSCTLVCPPQRQQSGLVVRTNNRRVPNASLEGAHFTDCLGYGDNGPTLEDF
jgi:predicted enzyme related to lactoylglutathione lyase